MTDLPLRLDIAVAARGLVRSRTEAQSLIAAGQVSVDGTVVLKSRTLVMETNNITVQGERSPFVSRGGLKLAAALDFFGIQVSGCRALDVGVSTGGFSDCLLQRGAERVEAIDVGHGQLAQSLAGNPRLHAREGVNIRALTPGDYPFRFDIIVADLSFISLTLALPAMTGLLAQTGEMVCLVKPQFEVGAGNIGKDGIVRSSAARLAALERVIKCALSLGLNERGRMDSPITGSVGNREYLLWLAFPAGETEASRE